MKPVRFVGSTKDDISAFPKSARTRAGYELFMVQIGRAPDDWKPIPTVGAGACEIRVRDQTGAFRVIYVAGFENAVYVCIARVPEEDAQDFTHGPGVGEATLSRRA